VRLIPVFLRILMLATGSLLFAAARGAPEEFNLPAQPAGTALMAFSKQTKTELLFSFDELRAVHSSAVVGRHEPAAALDLLLKDTGFAARRNARGKYVISRAAEATGGIKGRLIVPEGAGASGIRLVLADTRRAVVTNERGEFTFASVPPGTHQLVATGDGFQPLHITRVRVLADRVVTLEPQTMRSANPTTRLEPFVVEARTARRRLFDRGSTTPSPHTATGNLDLPRTQDDALPYTIYDRAQIARAGVVSLNEFLQRKLLDSAAAAQPPDQRPSIAVTDAFIATSSNLSLRGYTADETVVLVNGRRLPEVLTGKDGGNGRQQPDVNIIPISLVERVEVLPVSASAIYSGNSVGGVINIVLRPDADHTEITGTYTNALGGFDAPQSTISLQHGQSLLGGALRVRLNATFTRATPPTEAELGFVRGKVQAHPVAPENLFRATPNVRSADGSPLFGPGTASFTSVAPRANGTGGIGAFAGRAGMQNLTFFDAADGLVNSPNSVDFPYGRRQQGKTYFASAAYDVCSWLQLGVDAMHSRTVSNRGYFVAATDLQLSASSPFNPFQKDVAVSLNEIAPQLGPNYGEARLAFTSAVFGALFKLPAEWRVSMDAQYGNSLTKYRGVAGFDGGRWQELVDQGRYNPLRDTQAHDAPADFYDRVLYFYGGRGRFVTLGDYDVVDAAVRVTNQSLRLPTGSGAVSVGGDYRWMQMATYVDDRRFGDGTPVDIPERWAGRTLERVSVFGEVQAPVVPARWLPRWIREIQVDLAARYVAAATAQETNLAPTGGLKIDFAGGFSVRATVATSNRLPSPLLTRKVPSPIVPGQGGGGEVGYIEIKDPRRGNETNTQVLASDVVNPNLYPESAVTRTAGVVFQRGEVHRFRLAVDFSDTQKSGELWEIQRPQEVVDLEKLFPDRVLRAAPETDPTYGVGVVKSVLTGNVNLAWRQSQNWNTSFDYAWTECLGGRLDVYGRWIFFQRYDRQILPDSPIVDELEDPDTADASVMKHRANFGAGWANRNFGFGMDAHYFHSRVLPLSERALQGSRQIDPYWQFDAFVQSDLTRWLPEKFSRSGLRGQLRVNNVFDASPSKFVNTIAGVQPYGDWRGRVYSVSVTATF
jgi:iron complex outermembrane receptor protein